MQAKCHITMLLRCPQQFFTSIYLSLNLSLGNILSLSPFHFLSLSHSLLFSSYLSLSLSLLFSFYLSLSLSFSLSISLPPPFTSLLTSPGAIVSVTEKRLLTSFGEESIRLKISEPPEYRGWITEKPHITLLIEDEGTIAATAAENADPEITAELNRRSQVRAHRAQLAVKNSKQVCERLVKLSGLLDVNSETLFLLNGAQKKPGVSISPDFTSGLYRFQ